MTALQKSAWDGYRAEACPRTRSAIAAAYYGLMLACARAFHARLPRKSGVEVNELLAEASLRLMREIDRFDPARAEFETFICPHLRGAMLDYLRKNDWVPRRDRTLHNQGRLKRPLIGMVSLETTVVEGGRGPQALGNLLEDPSPPPGFDLEQRDQVRRMLRTLPRTHRLLLTLYYLDGLRMKECGRVCGFSEAWASQIIKQALAALKSKLAAADYERS